MTFMKLNELSDVDIAKAIAVSKAEVFVAEIFFYAANTAAGHRCVARIHECNFPGLGAVLVHFHFVIAHIKSDIRKV